MSAPDHERVALVTGAARGVGAATVRRLSAQGYGVLAVDWCVGEDSPAGYPMATPGDLEEVGRLPGVVTYVADVRSRPALDGAVERALAEWGRVDVVVAAAAVMSGGAPAWETSEATLDLLWEVDVKGVWHTASAAVPAMLVGPDPTGCRIVAVASAAGEFGLYRLAAYTAAKHAVVGFVKALAADLVGTGVTAVAVSPGSTRTPMLEATAGLYGLAGAEEFAEHQLVRRVLEPDEVAATVAFCASVEGGVLNGSVVHADGGFSP